MPVPEVRIALLDSHALRTVYAFVPDSANPSYLGFRSSSVRSILVPRLIMVGAESNEDKLRRQVSSRGKKEFQ
jgi:hypothetical protein